MAVGDIDPKGWLATPKIVFDPGFIDNGGRGVHRVIDLMDHRCAPMDGAPELGAWKWRCPICGQRWVGISRGGGFKEATQKWGTSWAWKWRQRRRRIDLAGVPNPQQEAER